MQNFSIPNDFLDAAMYAASGLGMFSPMPWGTGIVTNRVVDDAGNIIDISMNLELDNICYMISGNINIVDIEIIVPNKVVKVYFDDGRVEKMVCHKDDTFDLRRCMFIAISKVLYRDLYNWEGIEHMADQISYQKKYSAIVDAALKSFTKRTKKKEEEEKKAAEEAERFEKRRKKRAAYLKRRDEKRAKSHDEKLMEQAKVLAMAMKIYGECDCETEGEHQ